MFADFANILNLVSLRKSLSDQRLAEYFRKNHVDKLPDLVPFPVLFPEAARGIFTLTLPVQVGKAKGGW